MKYLLSKYFNRYDLSLLALFSGIVLYVVASVATTKPDLSKLTDAQLKRAISNLDLEVRVKACKLNRPTDCRHVKFGFDGATAYETFELIDTVFGDETGEKVKETVLEVID